MSVVNNLHYKSLKIMKALKLFFVLTDVGFIVYWTITLLHIIPGEYLFKDYNNPILVAWNFSFLPLDLLISFTGFSSLFLYQKGLAAWNQVALISLVLTFCSGLQAIAFWAMRLDFDLTWWLPNLFLLVYPVFFIPRIISNKIY
jgi:Family of unknown function (DUF5360)